tara:strand:- start:12 stop:518 length:507 start_codon:yes stop_codon:yes gene_type:complete
MRGTQIRQADEVRVFAHDARPIVIGAVNKFEITVDGFGYDPADVGSTLTATTGTPALTATIDAVTSGSVSAITITNPGGTYSVGDVLSFTGGTGSSFRITVTSIDIPGTENRGVCLYVGDISGGSDVEVVMESGNTAMFKGVTAGSFLPVLVTSVTSNTTASEILALY